MLPVNPLERAQSWTCDARGIYINALQVPFCCLVQLKHLLSSTAGRDCSLYHGGAVTCWAGDAATPRTNHRPRTTSQ